jgi:lysophospholipase L1-like esterase
VAFWLIAVALVVVLALVGLGFAEIGMRLAGARPVEREEEPPSDFLACDKDPEVGWIFPGSTEGVFRRGASGVTGRTNRWGLRSPETAPGDADVTRILVIGDSFAFGWGVEEGEAFPRRLEALLRARHPHRRIEVVNAAIPGYSQYQQLALLRRLRRDLRVDGVVSTFSLSNDMIDEVRIRRYAGRLTEYTPRPRNPESALSELIRRSYALSWLDFRTRALQFQAGNALPGSVRRAEESLRGLAAECAADGIAMLLVRVPRRTEITDAGVRLAVARFMTRGARAMHDRVGRELGLPVVDLTEPIARVEQGGTAFLPNDPHWTPEGHRAVADFLLEDVDALISAR